MSTPQSVVIVGAGLAGAQAAQTLRADGYDGRLVLLGAERERPYERPPLSKAVLRGEADRDSVFVHDAAFYDARSIELRTGVTVDAIDRFGAAVVLGSGERVAYDRLLLATGARPRRLTLPGAELDGIFELRTRADADVLAARLGDAGHVVVIGAGWIGCEVAASARELGAEVTIVEALELPLQHALGRQIGAFYRNLHAAEGVRLHLGARVAAFEGDGAVSAVRTGDGTRIACDVVVVGIGVTPRDEIADRAAIDTADGILVDEYLQTNLHGVYAAGDVARAYHPLLERSLRVEHWANALQQGAAAARSMLGAREAYAELPYVFSEQYDVAMEYTGHAAEWDDVVVRGDVAARAFVAFWLREGRVLAGMNVNVWDVSADIGALIRAGQPVDRNRLADPGVALADLLAAGSRE
jgi:3-phenylpropionate/trans-cinnamate dioxygenase ferredoxin reductase subunit